MSVERDLELCQRDEHNQNDKGHQSLNSYHDWGGSSPYLNNFASLCEYYLDEYNDDLPVHDDELPVLRLPWLVSVEKEAILLLDMDRVEFLSILVNQEEPKRWYSETVYYQSR